MEIVAQGPHRVLLHWQTPFPVIIVETSFGMVLRYEADMEFFFLGCRECFGRLHINSPLRPYCRECKTLHEEYAGQLLMTPAMAPLESILQRWAEPFLDSLEVVLTAAALAKRLKALHQFLAGGEIDQSKPYQQACEKFSGALEIS